ncbi:VENN motif pre-toxin domain-containing protein, partial [Xenorhabdus cabanillasii]
MTPDEKEKISNLSTLAGGLAGAQTAKNAVDANRLTTRVEKERIQSLAEKGFVEVEGTEEWIKYKQLEEKGSQPEYATLREQLAKEETIKVKFVDPYGRTVEYDVLLPMFQYGTANKIEDGIVYANGKYQLVNRAGGLLQLAGGTVEYIGGSVSCSTGITCAVGAFVAAQGLDNMYSGSNTLVSGKPVKTMGAKGLEALGVPPEYSEISYAAIGLGGSITTVLTSPKTGKSVTVLVDKDSRITRSFSNKGDISSGKGNSTPKQTNLPSNVIVDAEAGGYSYYDKFRNKDGSWNWPKNLGFAEDPRAFSILCHDNLAVITLSHYP